MCISAWEVIALKCLITSMILPVFVRETDNIYPFFNPSGDFVFKVYKVSIWHIYYNES